MTAKKNHGAMMLKLAAATLLGAWAVPSLACTVTQLPPAERAVAQRRADADLLVAARTRSVVEVRVVRASRDSSVVEIVRVLHGPAKLRHRFTVLTREGTACGTGPLKMGTQGMLLYDGTQTRQFVSFLNAHKIAHLRRNGVIR